MKLQQNGLQGKLLQSNSIRMKRDDINTKKPQGVTTQIRISWSPILAASALCTLLITSLVALQRVELKPIPLSTERRVLSCYYIPSNESALHMELIAGLCTHINVGFARVVARRLALDEELLAALPALLDLKRANPALKLLLSVGGARDDDGFPDMVVNHTSRKDFIRSVKSVLKTYRLDGIDLDWEFPAMHYSARSRLGGRERQHFSQLLREIRMEYDREKRGYLLTVAVAAPQVVADVAYDVDQIALYADYANLMTYDFHYYSKYTPFTGFNSPLFARPSEELYLATLNLNYTVHMYEAKGLSRDKMVVGIPTYAHTFTLVNPSNGEVGSPASGFGRVGALGFADSGVVCAFVAAHAGAVAERFDEHARAAYLHAGAEWLSCETERSAREKATYAAAAGLRGAMLYSLNADDSTGVCGKGAFPLTRAVRSALDLA